ncbi:MAG: RNA methyltransferase [Acidimicrobiia bacterium]|nr:RNA methyltransferase [Acidimicrobiia bacterium]
METVAGPISVDAVLRGGNRDVARVVVGPRRPKRIEKILAMAAEQQVGIDEVSEAELDELVDRNGGIVAEVGERAFLEPDAIWDLDPLPFVANLDGIEDPFNFGQAIRTLFASGCTGILLAERNWMTATATVTRSSAGATELMPMAVQPVADAVDAAEARGASVVATSDRSEHDVHDVDLTGPLLVLFGGEKRGVTRSVLSRVEAVRIPYGRRFPRSLGTVAATSVVAFEVLRQRSG